MADLTTYVIDQRGAAGGRLRPEYFTGQDMTDLEIVRNFVDQGGKAQFVATEEF